MCNGKSRSNEGLLRDRVTLEILRYLVEHPSAKDTVSGIQKWWLPESMRVEGKRKTEECLDLLVSKGWLVARTSPRSETIYSLDESRLPEIGKFLGE
jgi:hypothetical protein